MRVFVQTRGTARAADYAFLGGAPPEPWWRAYRDATAFDHPTVLLTSDGGRWAAYLSGIPSSRVDAVSTVVRYTLVLDGPCGTPDAACVVAAVGAWLDDVAAGHGDRPGGRLAAALDARFPADDVERWLAVDAPTAEVRRRVLAGVAALPAVPGAADVPGDWIGAVAATGPRVAFTARVAALVDGTPGRALLLNLVGGPDDVQPLLDTCLSRRRSRREHGSPAGAVHRAPSGGGGKKSGAAAGAAGGDGGSGGDRGGAAGGADRGAGPDGAGGDAADLAALIDVAEASAFDTRITAVGTRSRARLVFSVGGMWRGAGDDRSTAELSGVVTEAGTDRHLPVEGTLTVRLGRVVHTELHLRFGDGRITAARDVDLAPTSLPRILGQTQQFLGQVLHQVAAPGQITLPGTLDGGGLEAEDVDVSIDLVRLLRVALRVVR